MFWSILVVITSLIAIIALIYSIYIKIAGNYTRERFAFSAFLFISSTITSLISQIFAKKHSLEAFIYISNSYLKTNLETVKTETKDFIIISFIIIAFMFWIYKMYQNWRGVMSEQEYDKRRYNETYYLIEAAELQWKDFFRTIKRIKIHADIESIERTQIILPSLIETTQWHENVQELLMLKDQQYAIYKSDYYVDNKCFLSTYGQSKKNIAIFCSIDYPSNQEIILFVDFAHNANKAINDYIIVVKNYNDIEKVVRFNDIDIRITGENILLESLIDLSSYREFIRKSFEDNPITYSSPYTLKDVYTSPNGHIQSNTSVDIESYVKDWVNDDYTNKHLALLGEYGCGKSVLSLKIAYNMLVEQEHCDRIPILIELRGLSIRNLTIEQILSLWSSNHGINIYSLLKLMKAGKLLLIFEGFDEMDMIGDREIRLNHFQRIWEFAIPKSKIIITGRPNFFFDDAEQKRNLGIDKPHGSSPYCEDIYIEKFNKEKIIHFLRKIKDSIKEQILDLIANQNNSNFYDLISRPSILYLVSVIWEERKLINQKDKINSAIVISEFIKYTYSRQSDKNISFPLLEKEREFFMMGIAVAMWKLSANTNSITFNDLKSSVIKLYENFPEKINYSTSAMMHSKKPLKERMQDNPYAEETIMGDILSCGILVKDLINTGKFKFAHKSFLEYKVSLAYTASIIKDDDYTMLSNTIFKALNTNSDNIIQTSQTIAFTADLLIAKSGITRNDDPIKICKSLFSIIHPNKLLKKNPYLATLKEVYGYDLDFWVYLIFSLNTIIGANWDFNFIKMLLGNNSTIFSIFTFTYFIWLLITYKGRRKWFSNRKVYYIWLRCCKELNISESDINKVIPKHLWDIVQHPKQRMWIVRIVQKFFAKKQE